MLPFTSLIARRWADPPRKSFEWAQFREEMRDYRSCDWMLNRTGLRLSGNFHGRGGGLLKWFFLRPEHLVRQDQELALFRRQLALEEKLHPLKQLFIGHIRHSRVELAVKFSEAVPEMLNYPPKLAHLDNNFLLTALPFAVFDHTLESFCPASLASQAGSHQCATLSPLTISRVFRLLRSGNKSNSATLVWNQHPN
jgi:hypothetical protein